MEIKEIKTYFFDTYAFYEVIEANEDYKPFTHDIAIITTKFNLFELHYGLLAKYGKDIADAYYNFFVKYVVEITDDAIKEASSFKFSMKKHNLSYVDCLGYILAKQHKVPFLTGDKEFKDMDNVTFVK